MPLTLVRGVIDELNINVPWMSVGRENISMKAKNCFALLKLDLTALHHFDALQSEIRGKKVLSSMERRIVDTFKQIQNKKYNYLKYLINGLLRSLQVAIENLRVRVELVDLADVAGGFELVFKELNYDNNIQNMSESRFEGEVQTNGLNIVDLRIKSIKKEKIICLEHDDLAVRALQIGDFKAFFQNEASPSYILHPFMVHITFTNVYLDENKDKYARHKLFEFSPVDFHLSNEDVQVINAALSILAGAKEYSSSKKLSPAFKLRCPQARLRFEELRLNRLINKARAESRLRNLAVLRQTVEGFREKKNAYEHCYEVKILHLMENEFEKTTERLYDLQMVIQSLKGEAQTVEDTIQKCDEIEKSTHYLLILYFRDNVMVKIRSQAYFRAKLLDRKKKVNEMKEKDHGVITGILKKGISKIWSSKKEAVHLDDLLGVEGISKEDRALKENFIKFDTKVKCSVELKCVVVKCALTRHCKKLLELDFRDLKLKHSEDFVACKSASSLRLTELKVLDENQVCYLEIGKSSGPPDPAKTQSAEEMSEKKPFERPDAQNKPSNYCLDVAVDSLLIIEAEKEEVNLKPQTLDIRVQHITLYVCKELLSKLVYFSIDFSDALQSQISTLNQQPGQAPKKTPTFVQMLHRFTRLEEQVSRLNIEVQSVMAVAHNTVSHELFGLRFVPACELIRGNSVLRLEELECFYSDGELDLARLRKEPGLLASVPKLLKPAPVELRLARKSQSSLTLDVRCGPMEVFVSNKLLWLLSNLVKELSSISFLSREFIMNSLKKDVKAAKKKKPFGLARPKPTFPSNLSFFQSIRSSRKASNQTFVTANSELFEEEFFDVFEDETELFAHNELKNRLALVENAALLFSPQLEIIQENEQAKYQPKHSEKSPEVEVSLKVFLERVSAVCYSQNDADKYIQAALEDVQFFADSRELALRFQQATFILKQNILGLLVKDMWLPLQALLKHLGLARQKLLGPAEAPEEEAEDPEAPPQPLPARLGKALGAAGGSFNFELRTEGGVHVYLTEQVDGVVSPGIFLSLAPVATLNEKVVRAKMSVKLDVFHVSEEVGFYEPFVEELLLEGSLGAESSHFKVETSIPRLLLNVKPSIVKNLLDYVSVYSSQKIRLSAEKNSMITLKNETGLQLAYTVNANGVKKALRPNDVIEVNLFVIPKGSSRGAETEAAKHGLLDLSLDALSLFEKKSRTLQLIGRTSEEEGDTKKISGKSLSSTSFFSKKKIQLEIPSFEKAFTIDMSNMTDSYHHICANMYLVAKLEVDNYQSFLTLRSNYLVSNTLEFDVECAVYLEKSANSKEDFSARRDLRKKNKKSDALSEGDNVSQADSFDLSTADFPRKLPFQLNPPKEQPQAFSFVAEKEVRSTLLLRFIIKSRGKKYLPLLRNFPNNYYLVSWPAHQDFYEAISSEPAADLAFAKSQNLDCNRVYFQDLFKDPFDCSKISLHHSVGPTHPDVPRAVLRVPAQLEVPERGERDRRPAQAPRRAGRHPQPQPQEEAGRQRAVRVRARDQVPAHHRELPPDQPELQAHAPQRNHPQRSRQHEQNVALEGWRRALLQVLQHKRHGADRRHGPASLERKSAGHFARELPPPDHRVRAAQVQELHKAAEVRLEGRPGSREKKAGSAPSTALDIEEYMRQITEDPGYSFWQENRIHHMLNAATKTYSNYLIHTSKSHTIHRVNISAQYWLLNELLNPIEAVFREKGYTFEPLPLDSFYLEPSNHFGLDEETAKKLRDSSVFDQLSFDNSRLSELISAQNFRCMTKREKSLLIGKHASIKTFTGTPFDSNKSSPLSPELQLMMREVQANKAVDLADLTANPGKPDFVYFSSIFKGEKFRRIEVAVSTYLLGKEFGGAYLISISPAFILVNETDLELKYTFHSSFTNAMTLSAGKFTPLVLRSERGSEVISRVLFFNCDTKK